MSSYSMFRRTVMQPTLHVDYPLQPFTFACVLTLQSNLPGLHVREALEWW